jgi:cellulose biosynthesis protein BcsQ
MKIISFFNHKGGVCKTTTAYHLGWKLSEKGKRVLLVDADSQCNLTLTVIGEDKYENFIKEEPSNNIKTCLSYAFESKPDLIPAARCIPVKENPNLFLLPGNFDITEFEVQLGVSFQLTSAFSTMKNLPGSFYYLLKKTSDEHNIDFVLVDLNPSLSAINQDFVISSDYFILPAAPDFFSQMAIKSISRILPIWEKWAVQAREIFKDSTYPLPKTRPRFLGYTINDYTIRKGAPATAFQAMIDKIDSVVQNELAPSLRNVDLMLPEEKYKKSYCLAQVSNFQTLQAKYQEYGLPVFALTSEQLGTRGQILKEQKQRQVNFGKEFTKFADKILVMTA